MGLGIGPRVTIFISMMYATPQGKHTVLNILKRGGAGNDTATILVDRSNGYNCH